MVTSLPCPICGCPYPEDHMLDCPGVVLMPLEKRLQTLEGQLLKITEILEHSLTETQKLAEIVRDMGRAGETNAPDGPF